MKAPRERFALRRLEFAPVLALLRPHLTSGLGRSLLEACGPLADPEAVRRAHAETAEMAGLLAEDRPPPLSGLEDCREWLRGMVAGGRLPEAADLGRLLALLKALDRIRLYLEARAEAAPRLAELGEALPDLADLRETMAGILDERGRIQDRASAKLYALRAALGDAEQRLQQILRSVLADKGVTRWLQSTQVVWRGGHPALQVKSEHRGRVPGIYHDRSQSGATVFVEPEQAVVQANQVGDLRGQEGAEVARLLAELTRTVVGRRGELLAASELAGRFDFTCARASFARKYGLAVPEVAEGWPLRVRGARHPFLVQAHHDEEGWRERVVPLDLTLGEAHDVVVVTGPNTGGKTVALKTLGLVATMALAGLPVFADRARVPLLDGVFADIGDEQEIAQNLSTFSGHLKRIVAILERSTAASLVLLDELGAGTDPNEGGALGYTILERLLGAGVKVLASTHLGVLKTFAHQHERAENGAMEFDPETLEPLFRLYIGIPGSSNALVIARRMGLDPALVARAEGMLERPDEGVESLVDKLQRSRLASERSRTNLEKLETMADSRLRDLEEQSRLLEERGRVLHLEADQRAHAALRAARERLKEGLAPLLQAPGSHGERARRLAEEVARLLDWSPLAAQRKAFLEGLRKGDTIRIPRFRFRGPVDKVDKRKRKVRVIQGGLTLDVPFDDVVPDDE